ncbi:hypothetical protein KKE14_01055 [Patescibacteria group bacterium]|nr:hypothetical protein [Patescibacteria group bacterium]
MPEACSGTEVSAMLSNISFKCAGACLLAALVLILTTFGCSGSGTPITPDVQEIKIISPVNNSEWGNPQGVWQVVFTPISFGVINDSNVDYVVNIDNHGIEVVKPPYGNNYKMLSVVVPKLEVGDHQLQLIATLFGRQIAKGTVIVTIPSDRELKIEIIEPNSTTSWDIGDTVEISWTSDGASTTDNYDVLLIHNEVEVHKLGHSEGTTLLKCEVPIVETPASSNFQIKVVVNDGMAETESEEFIIDYGPLSSLDVDYPSAVPVDTDFGITVTAKDQYDNTIVNYNTTIEISIAGATITPWTIGNGSTTGTWSNGTVTHDGYKLSSPGSIATLILIPPGQAIPVMLVQP